MKMSSPALSTKSLWTI